jgi:hypothetical protein
MIYLTNRLRRIFKHPGLSIQEIFNASTQTRALIVFHKAGVYRRKPSEYDIIIQAIHFSISKGNSYLQFAPLHLSIDLNEINPYNSATYMSRVASIAQADPRVFEERILRVASDVLSVEVRFDFSCAERQLSSGNFTPCSSCFLNCPTTLLLNKFPKSHETVTQ